MLAYRYSVDDIRNCLVLHGAWNPYPTIEDRGAWDRLSEATRKRLLLRGEANLGFEWPVLPATLFLEYARVGNRTRFERQQAQRRCALRDLVLAECIEDSGRFLDDIANGIWATCEETYWGYPAHVDAQAAGVGLPDVEEPTVDLFAAEAVALLAWVVYLMGERLDAVSPLIRKRVSHEAKCRVLDPCLRRDDFWWMGFRPVGHGVNNWNPWINSNWIVATLLLEADAERRAVTIHKILRSLDVFLGIYGEAGGCDEGPGYWGRAAASLFECLDALHSASGGAIDLFREPKIRNMGRFIMRTQIDDNYFVNFADASAVNHPPGSLVFRYGEAIDDANMMSFGAWLIAQDGGDGDERGDSIGRVLPALFRIPQVPEVSPAQQRPRDAWFGGIQVMVSRDEAGSREGLFVAAKGGHNAESHNHNDVGNLIVYADGKPLIVDAGVETYRRQTFSPQRYQIWTMQSAYHTLLPTVDGVMQSPGESFAARDVVYTKTDAEAALALDLAGAYPPEANLASWSRSIVYTRGSELTITDSYVMTEAAAEIVLGVLTPCEVSVGNGEVRFAPTRFGPEDAGRVSGSGRLLVPDAVSGISVERVPIRDRRLGGVWGDHLNRVMFTVAAPQLADTWIWRVRSLTEA